MSYVLGILPQDVNKVKVAQSCPTLCDTMVFTVHGILQAGIGEWVAFPFSRGSSQLREQTQVFHIACRFFTNWAIREALRMWISTPLKSHREILHPPFGLSWCLLLNVHFKNLWEFLKKKTLFNFDAQSDFQSYLNMNCLCSYFVDTYRDLIESTSRVTKLL